MNNSKCKIKEVVIVEGRYDKNTLSQLLDALIIETSGFGVFNSPEKREFIRRAAEKNGIIILTDSDSSGMLIRNYIKGFVKEEYIKNAYIPQIAGKEKRKARAGKEGLLGVEGMNREVILRALRVAGATFLSETQFPGENPAAPGSTAATGSTPPPSEKAEKQRITAADLYRAGLSGRPDSREKRLDLLKKLGLPSNLSSKALLEVLNRLCSPEELENILQNI